MSEVEQVEEIEEIEEAQEETQEEEQSAEERAKVMGWSSKEDYKGDPDLWKPAEEFIKDADEDFRRMRTVNQHMERKIDKQEKSLQAIIAHQEREIAAREKEAYERGKQEIMQRHAQAVEDGDVDAAKTAMEEIGKLKQPESVDPNVAMVESWKSENSWFNTDPVMSNAAKDYCDMAAARGETVQQQLEGAAQYVRETYPQKFRQPKKAPAMVGSSNNVHKNTAPKAGSYEALTQEARHECDKAVASSGGKITKEAWLRYAEPIHFQQ